MDPRKTDARRGYAKRQQERENARRQAASEWQPEVFTPKEGKKMKTIFYVIFSVVLVVGLALFCLVASVWMYQQVRTPAESNIAAVAPTNTPIPEPTKAPELTEVVATPIVPAPVSCTTPSIKAGISTADTEFGEYLDTTLGKRMTFTSRKVVVPTKAWNDPLSAEELKSVETTWLYMQVCVPKGTFGRVFAGGFEQGINRYENGVLMTLQPGLYEFKIRNGEVVLWYPNQDSFAEADFSRIIEQIRNGNFDIHSALAFFATTADLLPHIPADMVSKDNVQIAPFPEPVTK